MQKSLGRFIPLFLAFCSLANAQYQPPSSSYPQDSYTPQNTRHQDTPPPGYDYEEEAYLEYGQGTDNTYREIKVGLMTHDVRSDLSHGLEKGFSQNLEYLFPSPENALFEFIFSPHPHIGFSRNSQGHTSHLYAGLTWNIPIARLFFVELAFGGTIHNGHIKRNKGKHKGYGSRLLFHESISAGILLRGRHSVSVILSHASNANLGDPNPGFTDFGLRYGFRF